MNILEMLIPMLVEGMKTTVGVFVITLVFSIPLSVAVAGLRLSKSKVISKLTAIYIYLMRGTPLLLQLMFIYFGLPMMKPFAITLSREMAIYVAFILNYTAYFAEIFRGGIQSIDKGQWEAGEVLGMGKVNTFKIVILPQVVKNILPSISNEIITLVKDTSLVYILGVSDILKAAKATSNALSTFTPYIFVAIVYLILIALLSRLLAHLEKRQDYYR